MRFSRLDLLAYGKFTDKSVELPSSATDFHLLYGPNEAGKSTLRSAVVDFLYGIPGQTALNFLHDYSHMRLGAVVEGAGRTLELTRRKGNKNTLREADDTPFADEALAELLGGGDRAFYERMFALSHERLREGGQEILDGKGDAAEALFSAAAGVRGLHVLRGDLEQEAKQLWTPRKSRNVRYYQLADELADATLAKREATAGAKKWREADRELAEADDAYRDLGAKRDRLVTRRSQLERIRRVAPHLRARRGTEDRREALGPIRMLPPEAADTLRTAEGRIALAKDRCERLAPEIEELNKSLAQAPRGESVLLQASEIDGLIEEQLSLSRHEGDIIKRHGQAQAAQERMLSAAKELGWGEASTKALRSLSPSRTTRARVRGLLEKRGAAEQRAESARKDFDGRTKALHKLETRGAELEVRTVSAAWKMALARARKIGDSGERRAELERLAATARRECERALAALDPWRGSAEDLRQPPPVSARQASELLQEIGRVEEVSRRYEDQSREAAAALAENELALRQLIRDRAPVTSEDVNAARADRDRLWAEIASGAVLASDIKNEYEPLVESADALADRRFEGVEAVAQRTGLRNKVEQLKQRLQGLEFAKATDERKAEGLRQDWREATKSLGEAEFPIGDYSGWLSDRERALEKSTALDEAEAALVNYDRRVEQLVAALREAWERESGLPQPVDGDDLGAWVARTESVQQTLASDSDEKVRLDEEIRESRYDCERAREEMESAEASWRGWEEDWSESLNAVGLAENLSPEEASEALQIFGELEEATNELGKMQDRIRGMQADQQGFVDNARRMAEAILPDWTERSASDIVAELKRRLHDAREAERVRDSLTQRIDRKREELTSAESDLTAARAELRPLMEVAEAPDVTALRAAVERSDEGRQLDELVAEETKRALDAGSPMDLASLQHELDSQAEIDPAAELAQIESELKQTQQQIEEAVQARKDAQHKLDDFGAGDAAARAEGRRQEALSEMIAVSESWVRTTVETQLLRWAIRRYREQRQTPLLQRAGELFQDLTLGSFERLMIEEDGDQAVIVGRRRSQEAGSEELRVEAMSDGTRDQLYLSLRVAALELHLDDGEPLPFLADDLFVNWDNERARAGLRVLAELSRRTQVLFLTHHKHLLTLAEEASGEGCSVHELTF